MAEYYRWCLTQDKPIPRQIAEAIRISYGGTPEEKPELYRRHSALANFARLTMPLYLVHGGADDIMPVEQARALAEKMTGFKNFFYVEIPGGDHDSPIADEEGFPKIVSMI